MTAAEPTSDGSPVPAKFDAILLFGPPGVGKGTQGQLLGHLPGFLHVASGDIFRALDKESELGRTFLEYSSKGELVPDDLTIKVWREFMERLIKEGAYRADMHMLVLDGIPRNKAQAEIMDEHIRVQRVINLTVDDETLLLRRMQRRAEKEGRHDDAQETVIRNRFEVYRRETTPMLEHYGPARVTNVNAVGTPGRVLINVLNAAVPVQEATFGNPLERS